MFVFDNDKNALRLPTTTKKYATMVFALGDDTRDITKATKVTLHDSSEEAARDLTYTIDEDSDYNDQFQVVIRCVDIIN